MPVQFPTLSGQEQTDRVTRMAKNTLFPYAYPWRADFTAGNFPSTSTPGNIYNYFSMGFQSPHNLAISDLEITLSILTDTNAVKNIFSAILQVSYSPVLFFPTSFGGTPPAVPTIPPDVGNIIYQRTVSVDCSNTTTASFAAFDFADFHRFEPYNYLVKYNQIIYMHVGVTPTGKSGTIQGNFLFHTLESGVQS